MGLMEKLLGKQVAAVPVQRVPVLDLEIPAGAVCCPGDAVEVDIVGESFHEDYLQRLAYQVRDDTFPMVLVPEPHNPYDENAVAVQVGGQVVGHLSRQTCRAWQREILRVNAEGQWVVGSAHLRSGSEGRIGVFGTAVWPGVKGKAPKRTVR